MVVRAPIFYLRWDKVVAQLDNVRLALREKFLRCTKYYVLFEN